MLHTSEPIQIHVLEDYVQFEFYGHYGHGFYDWI
jgi:hypothetical protein